MAARACQLRRVGLLLAVAAVAAAAEPAYHDTFHDNTLNWKLDDAWTFVEGELRVKGSTDQVAVVGQQKPVLKDFRAMLRCRWMDGPIGGSYGFLYRFDPRTRNGYFMAVSLSGGYGFGRVDHGDFELKARGSSTALMTAGIRTLTVEAQGDRHTLKLGDQTLDTWRDDSFGTGGFGLMVTDAVSIAFQELTIEAIGELPPQTLASAGPTPSFGPAPRADMAGFARLDMVDLERLRAWRRRYNAMAAALGDLAAPAEADATDLAAFAWLRVRQSRGTPPPAAWLAELLADPKLAAAGCTGAVPVATLEFALRCAAQSPQADALSGQEELLAGLTWYFTQRTRTSAAWGDKPATPLALVPELQTRLDADAQRWAKLPDLERRRAEWSFLAEKVKLLAPAMKH